jgi:hypothetical protein
VKNITVSVPDDVYRAARVRAAQRGTSVSAMVADYLRTLDARDAEFARLEEQERRIKRQIRNFNGSDRLDRDKVHEREVR